MMTKGKLAAVGAAVLAALIALPAAWGPSAERG